uniref:Uncharacterized protein n=1 Tax=Anguilla anguilla TaxID=7936 RepID=A0A0E9VE88_ANGAN
MLIGWSPILFKAITSSKSIKLSSHMAKMNRQKLTLFFS